MLENMHATGQICAAFINATLEMEVDEIDEETKEG